MGEDGVSVGNTELAGLLAGDFDTATAVRCLAAAVMRQSQREAALAKQIDELAAEAVRVAVRVEGLERESRGTARKTRKDTAAT